MSLFKRIKTSSFLLGTLVLFALFQLIAGALFLSALNSDNRNFDTAATLSTKYTAVTNAWFALNAARSDNNRILIWLQKEGTQSTRIQGMVDHAKEQLAIADRWFKEYQAGRQIDGFDQHLNEKLAESYQVYASQLNQLIGIAAQRDIAGLFGLNVAPSQQRMEQDYNAWRAEVNTQATASSVKSQEAYKLMQWLLGGIILLMVCFILLCWKVLGVVLIQPLTQALKHIKTIESGDLTETVEYDTRARNEMAQLLSGLSGMQQALATTVGNVRSGADMITTGVSQIASGNDDLSSRTEQQASSLEQTAASMEQITSTVKKNADNSHEAARLALSAAENAEKGGTIVDGVIKSIFGLEDSSKKISEITGVIESIAFQTNILALNAAVEAARAGEHGRGFAVVAGEVRNLAQRSAVAAKDINSLIAESSSRVANGSKLASQAEESMHEILISIKQVRDIMEEISIASDEQSHGIDQVEVAVQELDRVTQQNAALVQQSSASAKSLEEQAGRLQQAVSVFRIRTQQSAPVKSITSPATRRLAVTPAAVADDAKNWETF